MIELAVIIIPFIILVIVAIWYDKIIPPIYSVLKNHSSNRALRKSNLTDKTQTKIIKAENINEYKNTWFEGRTHNILSGIAVIAYSLFLRSGEGDFFFHWWGANVPTLIWFLWFIFGVGTLLIRITKKVDTSETFDQP